MCVFCVVSAYREHKGRQYVGCNSGNWYSWNTPVLSPLTSHKHIHRKLNGSLAASEHLKETTFPPFGFVCACICVSKCVSACICMYFIRITDQRTAWWLISDTLFPPLSSLFTFFSPTVLQTAASAHHSNCGHSLTTFTFIAVSGHLHEWDDSHSNKAYFIKRYNLPLMKPAVNN